MNKMFPLMLDRPEGRQIASGISYIVMTTVFLPWFLILAFSMTSTDQAFGVWFDLGYHALNFAATVIIFREYLAESFLNVQINLKSVLLTCGGAVLVIFGYVSLVSILAFSGSEILSLASLSALPISEVDQFCLPIAIVSEKTLPGTLCMALMTPVTISCLYYAAAFAPVCSNHGWLGYAAVAVLIAVPKIANALTFWNSTEELIIYLAQLPVHLIACWTYQKKDTVWAPILTLGVSNLITCGLMVLLGWTA